MRLKGINQSGIKRIAQNIGNTYKATIKGIVSSSLMAYEDDEDDEDGLYIGSKSAIELSQEATKYAKEDFDQDPNLLAGYLDHYIDMSRPFDGDTNKSEDSNLVGKVISIESPNIKVNEYGEVTTTFIIKTNAELNDIEIENLESFITGQCSDGWGEGFEQQSIGDGSDDRWWYISTWNHEDAVVTKEF